MGEHDVCDCIRCLARRAGLGPPPWGPADWAKIAPAQDYGADDPVKSDPAVVEATRERDHARANYEAFDDLWLQAVQAQSNAQLGQMPDGSGQTLIVGPGGMWTPKGQAAYLREAELAAAVREADERRQVAWQQVVKANEAIRRAQLVAQQRVEIADRLSVRG